jgi:thiamine-monophosphate kinase
MADEFERIAELQRRFACDAAQVALGIGDDAALLRTTADSVLSVDSCVEGVHFERELLDFHTLGRRALEAALSDLAAMGARPRACLCALILPTDLADAELYALADGYAEAAREAGAPVIGGNLARGRELSITSTVLGDAGPRTLTRGGARPGDTLFVTGELGAAALGLALLKAGRPELGPAFVTRWRAPRARLAEGQLLAPHASAAIDVSDGLLQDLEHLCRASGVGAELWAERLPLLPGHHEVAAALGLDGLSLALSGGEDYELIFTQAAPQAPAGVAATAIGGIVDLGVRVLDVLDAQGRPIAIGQRGFRHFGGSRPGSR